MHLTRLRKVGGSIMLALPRAVLDMLHLQAGATVGIAVDGDRLIVQTQARASYTLDELLSQCDDSEPMPVEDRSWLDDGAVGGELI